MALILCRSCKREIDSTHPICPHCQSVNPNAISSGKSRSAGVDWFSVMLMAFLFVVIIDMTINGSTRKQAQAKSQKPAPSQISSVKASGQSSHKSAAKSEAPPTQQARAAGQQQTSPQSSSQQQPSPQQAQPQPSPPPQQQPEQTQRTTESSSSQPAPLKGDSGSETEERAAVSEKISRIDKLIDSLDKLLGFSSDKESDGSQ